MWCRRRSAVSAGSSGAVEAMLEVGMWATQCQRWWRCRDDSAGDAVVVGLNEAVQASAVRSAVGLAVQAAR
jgi:hypothetical protein